MEACNAVRSAAPRRGRDQARGALSHSSLRVARAVRLPRLSRVSSSAAGLRGDHPETAAGSPAHPRDSSWWPARPRDYTATTRERLAAGPPVHPRPHAMAARTRQAVTLLSESLCLALASIVRFATCEVLKNTFLVHIPVHIFGEEAFVQQRVHQHEQTRADQALPLCTPAAPVIA